MRTAYSTMRTAYVAAVLIILFTSITASAERAIPVRAYLAPVGFVYDFGSEVEFKGLYYPGDTYIPVSFRGRFMLNPYQHPKLIITEEQRIPLSITLENGLEKPMLLRLVPGNRLLLVTQSDVSLVASQYNIVTSPDEVPSETVSTIVVGAPPKYVVIDYGVAYVNVSGAAVYVFVNPMGKLRIVYGNGSVVETPVLSYLGVSEACIVPVPEPWLGGIYDSPVCRGDYEPVLRVEEAIVAVRGRDGFILVFADPGDVEVLRQLGVAEPIEVPQNHHVAVMPAQLQLMNIYMYADGAFKRIEPLTAYDVSKVYDNGTAECKLPANAKVVAKLLWRQRQTLDTLLPGEAVVARAGNKLYVCHGELDFLMAGEVPGVYYPKYRELAGGVTVYALTDSLIVDARVEYVRLLRAGESLTIPMDMLEDNIVYVINSGAYTITATDIPSMLTDPLLWLVAGFGAAVVYGLRTNRVEPPRTVKLVFDITTGVASLASKKAVLEQAYKFVNNYAYCPDVSEVASTLLPPLEFPIIEYNGELDMIVCPFRNVNLKAEAAFRRLVELLRLGLWSVQRISSNVALAYTYVGASKLYFYIYIQGGEENSRELLLKALESAYRASKSIVHYGYPIPLGLVVVVESERMAMELASSIAEMSFEGIDYEEEGVVTRYDVAQFVESHSLEGILHVDVERLQKFVAREIPLIIPFHSNIRRIVCTFGKRDAELTAEYWERLGGV